MADQDDTYVDDLLRDARLVANYALRAGLLRDTTLQTAIAAVEKPPQKERWSRDVIALQSALSKSASLVPFSTLVELREGWSPGDIKGAKWRLTILLISSVLLMIVVGQLSQTYNRGVGLLTEIQVLSVSGPDRQFGQLARQLISAREEIALAGGDEGSDTLKQQAYFQIYDDLRDLDDVLYSLVDRVEKFREEAWYPVAGSRLFWDLYYWLQELFGRTDQEANKYIEDRKRSGLPYGDAVSTADAASSSFLGAFLNWFMPRKLAAMSGSRCPLLEANDVVIQSQVAYIQSKLGYHDNFSEMIRRYYYSNLYLFCFEYIQHNPYYVPNMESLKRIVNDSIAPYALVMLPGLFGAIGAIMYHLRVILDPIRPNPSSFRILHRTALGALAGMILAWFWVPDTRFGTELANIGFSLFGLAFLFGFSLDVFFALLDRFVSLSVSTIKTLGSK